MQDSYQSINLNRWRVELEEIQTSTSALRIKVFYHLNEEEGDSKGVLMYVKRVESRFKRKSRQNQWEKMDNCLSKRQRMIAGMPSYKESKVNLKRKRNDYEKSEDRTNFTDENDSAEVCEAKRLRTQSNDEENKQEATNEEAANSKERRKRAREERRQQSKLLALPAEILSHIFSYLPVVQVAQLARVCSYIKSIAQDEVLWKLIHKRTLGCVKIEESESWHNSSLQNLKLLKKITAQHRVALMIQCASSGCEVFLRRLLNEMRLPRSKMSDGANKSPFDPFLQELIDQSSFVPGPSLLGIACEKGRVNVMKMLLHEFGANPNASHNHLTKCPLVCAAAERQLEACKILIEAGANVDGVSWGTHPISAALAWNRPFASPAKEWYTQTRDVVRLLLEKGSYIAHYLNSSPLQAAAKVCHKGVVEMLLIHRRQIIGLPPHPSPKNQRHEKEEATDDSNDTMKEKEEQFAVFINFLDNMFQNTALLIAVGQGDMGTAELLLNYGADVDRGRRDGMNPLLCACWGGEPSMVSLLLRYNPNMNAVWRQNPSSEPQNALLIAQSRGVAGRAISALLWEHINRYGLIIELLPADGDNTT